MVVHGGHVTEDDDEADGFVRWRKAIDSLETDMLVLLENTAGGDHAMARHFDTIGRLWDHIGDTGIGFCLDTCHAWAAGEELVDSVERIIGITGRVDLVHCNDSKDEQRLGPGPAREPHPRPDRSRGDPRRGPRRRRARDLRDRRGGTQGRPRVPPVEPLTPGPPMLGSGC